jgi:hypothetical protein
MCKVRCSWKTCKNYKNGYCGSENEIELKSFDYLEEDGKEEKEGLKCTGFDYDKDWMLRPRAV